MQTSFLNYKLDPQSLQMNERTHSWDHPKDVAETLLNLDKEDRREYLRELPPDSTGIGSLMGFTKIEIDDDGHTSFYCKAEEFHSVSYTHLTLPTIYSV